MGSKNLGFRFLQKPKYLKNQNFRFLRFFTYCITKSIKNMIRIGICGVYMAESLLTGLVFTFRCAYGS